MVSPYCCLSFSYWTFRRRGSGSPGHPAGLPSVLPDLPRPSAKAQEHALEGRPGLDHGLPIEAVARTRAVDVPLDEARIAEAAEMLGDRRLGQGEELDEPATNTTLLDAQDLEDTNADRMG
jgi:hypothetical protein